MEILETVVVAVFLFAATNVDDLVLLAMFFAQPGASMRPVVLGQLAGIGALTAASYLAAMLALNVPESWIPWLGLLPLGIGIHWILRGPQAVPRDTPGTGPVTWWVVAAVVIANGADNLGAYIPTFASQRGMQTPVTLAVFLVLTLFWCVAARHLVRRPAWGGAATRFCQRLAPYLLIGLGLWILAKHPLFRG